MRFGRLFLFLLLAAGTGGARAVDVPAPYTALYSVEANGIKLGEMKRSLQSDGDSFMLKTEMYTTGFIAMLKDYRLEERSLWTLQDDGLVSQRYEYRVAGGSDKTERLEFDWSKGVVLASRDGDRQQMTLHPGVMDKLAYQVLLRHELANGKDSTAYQVAEWGRIRTYRFEVKGTERVETPLGTFDALKVERVRKKGKDDRITVFWLAKELNYMLVRIVQENDGNTFASTLLKLKPRNVNAAAR